jgi:hypothetical protein
MVANCNKFAFVKAGDGCYDLAATNAIPLDQFYSWNPAVGKDCTGLWSKTYVCVSVIDFTPGSPSTTAALTKSFTPTSTMSMPANGIRTPTPIQGGMARSCNAFYLVKQGDGCWAIANQYSIPLDNLYAWNSAVSKDCSGGLWPNYYICVGVQR